MRTRTVPVPLLYDDDTIVVEEEPVIEEPTLVQPGTMVGVPVQIDRQFTQDYDLTMRTPAESHFFVRAGFEAGAPTDVIADSIAAGVDWVVGAAWLARDSNWRLMVNLSDPDVPIDRRIAAWTFGNLTGQPIKEASRG
jgi:hypothetical protein